MSNFRKYLYATRKKSLKQLFEILDNKLHVVNICPRAYNLKFTKIICRSQLGDNLNYFQAINQDEARRSIRDVITYLTTITDVKDAIKKHGNPIKLRFAADGRKTSRRVGTVMAVFSIVVSIVAEGKQSYEYQYTAALYNGNYLKHSYIIVYVQINLIYCFTNI